MRRIANQNAPRGDIIMRYPMSLQIHDGVDDVCGDTIHGVNVQHLRSPGQKIFQVCTGHEIVTDEAAKQNRITGMYLDYIHAPL